MTTDTSNDMSTAELFGRTLLKSYEKASESVNSKIIPGAKQGVKTVFALLLAAFFASLFFVALGITLENNEIVTIGCLLKAGVSIVILAMLAPIGIAFESISKGKLSGKKYVRFMASCFTFQLLIAGAVLFSPMSVSLATFFTLTFASCLLALAIAAESSGVKLVSGIFFALSIFTLFFPAWRNKLDKEIRIVNEPSLVKMRPGDIRNGKIRFYVNGKPVIWYHLNRDGQYELFDAAGNHDQSPAPLKPITDSVLEILRANEDLISPRNLIKDSAPPPSSSNLETSAPSPATASAATSDTAFDFSGQWNFRWEKSSGASDWIPTRIERMDSIVRIVISYPNGSDMAYLEGSKTGSNSYSGRWNMTNNSGFGLFTINLQRAGFIEGSITDETAADKRPATIKFQKS